MSKFKSIYYDRNKNGGSLWEEEEEKELTGRWQWELSESEMSVSLLDFWPRGYMHLSKLFEL